MAYIQGTLCCALLAVSALAQSNAVPGTDVNLYEIGNSTIYGRRGPAYPNGEVGIGFGHAFCNLGTVHVPWQTSPTTSGQMTDVHFKIAFLVAAERNGRFEQISKPESFVKHSRVTYNLGSSQCGTCQSGPSSTFRIGCFDAYSTGFNGDRFNLGPSSEIDPWLGSWNPLGSYFDQGDPAVGGAAATDGTQSLSFSQVSAFDAVKNRVTIDESDLAQPGTFYGQVHLVCEGEPVANRGNNQRSTQLNINHSGSWSISTGISQLPGTVLNQWTGATVAVAGNGLDDGRFAVAAKVTEPSPGLYRYEYAVHNIDNSRAGATFRIPLNGPITVQNADFRDIDDDPLNDWSFAQTSSEIAWSATANNALEWNTIYNFSFESTEGPGAGNVELDQARVGPGGLTVAMQSDIVPGGLPIASVATIGASCGSCDTSFYEYFSDPSTVDLAGTSATLTLANGEYSAGTGTGTFRAPTGTNLNLGDNTETVVNLPFSLPYPGGSTTQLHICSNGFISPVTGNGFIWVPLSQLLLRQSPRWAVAWHDLAPNLGGQVLFDVDVNSATVTWDNVSDAGSSAGNSTFQAQFFPDGTVHMLWQSLSNTGNGWLMGWSPGGITPDPGSADLTSVLGAGIDLCAFVPPQITLAASDRPVMGTTIQQTIGSIAAGTPFGVLRSSLFAQIPAQDLSPFGLEGCFSYTNGGFNQLFVPNGAASVSIPLAIPNDPRFIGVEIVEQSFALVPPLTSSGFIASNGIKLLVAPL